MRTNRGLRTAAAGLLMWACAETPAQAGEEPAWARDMPTVEQVRREIRGENEAETLMKQCAVFGWLAVNNDLPGYGTAWGHRWRAQYEAAIADLGKRYADIRPLAEKNHRYEWDMACHTGQRVIKLGKLGAPLVAEDEKAALFKPSIRAAYEQARRIDRDKQSAYEADREARQDAARKAAFSAGLGTVKASLAVIMPPVLGVFCLLFSRRLARPVAKARFERTNQAGVEQFEDFDTWERTARNEGMQLAAARMLFGLGAILLTLGWAFGALLAAGIIR